MPQIKHTAMLKKICTFILIAGTALTSAVSARGENEVQTPLRNDQYGLFNHLGLGIDLISPDGFGLQLGAPITSWLQVRAGYSIVPWDIRSLPAIGSFPGGEIAVNVPNPINGGDPIHATFNIGMMRHTGMLMFDLLPSRKSSFHFTLGVLGGTADILSFGNITPLPDTYSNVGLEFYPGGKNSTSDNSNITNRYLIKSRDGRIALSLGRRWAVRPYLGIGWGTIVPSKRVGVVFDMGVEYTGGMGIFSYAEKYTTGVGGRMMLDGAGLKEFIERTSEQQITDQTLVSALNTMDTFSRIPVAPYLKLSLVIKLF